MKNVWLGMAPILLAGCQSQELTLSSDSVPQARLDIIAQQITSRYPDASAEQKQHAADVVVRAIENLVFVKGGSFDMGDFGAPCDIPSRTRKRIDWSPDVQCLSSPITQEAGAYPHKVTLDSYSLSKYETSVIDMEWMRQINQLPVARDDPYNDSKIVSRDSKRYQALVVKQAQHPTPTKYWQEAKDYCQWLGKISQLPFDLPTEAQWEYAARSRGQHRYFATNNGYTQLEGAHYYDPKQGLYIDYKDSEVNAAKGIVDLGTYPPNPLGIYGMSNQVGEWVNDWYSRHYYQHSPQHNPIGPKTGKEKVLRDGGGNTMTFDRIHFPPSRAFYSLLISFRCSLQSTAPAPK